LRRKSGDLSTAYPQAKFIGEADREVEASDELVLGYLVELDSRDQ
jgi:hypothetical protein